MTTERLAELWKQANEKLDKAPWYTFGLAAVDEARREEREACANLVSENRIVYYSHDPHYRLEPNNPRFGPDANQRAMAAAILARDKEPRDAER